ncbi:MAG: DUF134 domain-containing protein [Erysipelotrichaceae bacterium]|nr:DUF134 domain-containing protein [Erysipelotrichaceae bacterium]MDD3924096.1 DUF134 domain-containing protein [Erysipelotrichaceae bacterium]MDD4642260.1 DUF134 domain-containing protein [Erysipelotrichaceae bacterium]
MPRPRKWRMVCCLPINDLFGPLNNNDNSSESIVMSVDEYEVIRLMDLEGLTQNQCAQRMDVARATIQNSYKTARLKIAQAITLGKNLKIAGGDYRLYDDRQRNMYGCHRHQRNRFKNNRNIEI